MMKEKAGEDSGSRTTNPGNRPRNRQVHEHVLGSEETVKDEKGSGEPDGVRG